MRHVSEPIGSVELIDIAPSAHSPLISKCTIKVCYVQEEQNRNRTVITRETAIKMAPSLRGAVIAGYYNTENEDFEEHNRLFTGIDSEGNFTFSSNIRPYGFVDLGARVWFQNFTDDAQTTHTYLCTEGWLWTSAYPEAKSILEQGKGQSMELNGDSIEGSWSNNNNSAPEFFIISEAVVEKLVVLGEDYEPCFEGASITKPIHFTLTEDFKENVYSMLTELKEILEEGGEKSMEQVTVTPGVEEEEILPSEYAKKDEEEKKEETQHEDTSENKKADNEEKEEEQNSEKKDDEEEDDEKKKKEKDYALEYAELEEKYKTLETNYSALETEKSNLETELVGLREFKAKIDKQQKQDMIDSFTMLSEEDKKDVQDNIDSYSLDEIESKLSVICVRNKVSFATNEEEDKTTTYNLDNDDNQDESDVPAWIRALNAVVAEN